MGNCIGHEKIRQFDYYFQQDQPLQPSFQIYKPLGTTLFNTLRKSIDSILITDIKYQINLNFANLVSIDFENTTPNQLKALMNSKKIVYIGNYENDKQTIIKMIKAYVTFQKLYIVTETIIRAFLVDYPIFEKQNWAKWQIVTNKMPLLMFDTTEICQITTMRIRLFIHAGQKRNLNIYNLIGISKEQMIIGEAPTQQSIQKQKSYYLNALSQVKQTTMLLSHNISMDPDDLLDLLSTALSQKYRLPFKYAEQYLKFNMPTLVARAGNEDQLKDDFSKGEGLTDKLETLLKKLCKQSGQNKTQNAYRLISGYLVNIYSNPAEEQTVRKIKKPNRQVYDLLTKYKHGIKLFEELGFREKQDGWLNPVELKYLKIYKSQLDAAYKKFAALQLPIEK